MIYGSLEFDKLKFLTEYGFTIENHSTGRIIEIWCISNNGCIIYHEWPQFNDFDIFITNNVVDYVQHNYKRTYNYSWLIGNVESFYKEIANSKKWEKIDLVEFYLHKQIRDGSEIFGIKIIS